MHEPSLRRLGYEKVLRQLAEHTTFSAGRRLALELRPSPDPQRVRRALAQTGEARAYVDRHGAPPLAGSHDMRPEVDAARRGRTLLPRELLDIAATVDASRRVRRALTTSEAVGRWPGLAEVAARLEPCPALRDAIGSALDDEGHVLDAASPALRRIRSDLRTAHERLARRLEGLLQSAGTREYLQEPLITQRNGRHVVPVKSEFRTRVSGVVHDTSDSGATVFIEPLAVVELGNRCRELETAEEKEVLRVLRSLSEHVADEGEAIAESIAVLAELDLAFACAGLAHAQRATAPELLDGAPRFDLRGARHPLLDPATVVPIDVHAGRDFRVLVITGPNTGGKTVSLKTVGLLVLMAQSGLQLPVLDGSALGVFDGVYADIGDEQSIEQSLSTFSSHMTNIIDILHRATDRSLVLLDELGAGTDPAEGVALAGALLEHLRGRAVTTIASTHFSELKLYAHGTPDVANASVEFDVETLRPTYELTVGLPGRSNALAIAGRLGLPDDIVAAARRGMALADVTMEDLLAEIRAARRAAADDRAAAARARRQADSWAARLEAALADMESERARVLAQAHRQGDQELAAVRQALARLLQEAERGEATAAAVAAAVRRSDRVAEVVRAAAPAAPAPAVADELRPGSWVHVRGVGQEGQIVRLKDAEAEVQLGRLRLTVPLTDLARSAGRPSTEAESPAPRLRRATEEPAAVSMELDLRGLRVDEGLELLDAQLDRAVLAGLPWLRVIHGHGSGAMKSAVRDAVRHHPSVTRSRPGERGEGGDGVTVAYLE